MSSFKSPAIPRLLATFLLRGQRREVVLGDLEEEFIARLARGDGQRAARRWYWQQALASIAASQSARVRQPKAPVPFAPVQALVREGRHAGRRLRHRPGFALSAIGTLALAIGVATAVFTAVNALLITPLPYSDPDRLVFLWNRFTRTGATHVPIAAADVADFRELATSFDGFAATDRTTDAVLLHDGEATHVRLGRGTPNLFDLLGVVPVLGRAFLAEDLDTSTGGGGANPLGAVPVMLSFEAWRSLTGGQWDILGRTLLLDGQSAQVIGILPAGFALALPPDVGIPADIDIWAPLRLDRGRGVRDTQRFRDQDSDDTGAVIARLRAGATVAAARTEMAGIAATLRSRYRFHERAGAEIDVVSMQYDVSRQARPILATLSVAVAFVLLIACANVTSLVVADAIGRQREMAVRRALGATAGRLATQIFVEAGVLTVAAGVLGVIIAAFTLDLLAALQPAGTHALAEASISGRVLLFAAGTTWLSALCIGILPIMLHTHAATGLQRTAGSRTQLRVRQALVTAEVAISIVLVIGAGLLFRSVVALRHVDPGFDPHGVLAFDVSLRNPARYRGPADRSRFIDQIEAKIRELTGVREVGLVGRLPLSGRSWTSPYGLDEQPVDDWAGNEANFRMVTPGYFAAMGTTILAGRTFSREEATTETRRVVVVDEALAARLPGDRSAIGQRIGFPLEGRFVTAEIVGVVERVRHETLREESRETLYVPYRHEASRDISIVVRTTGDPTALVGPIRRQVRLLDPTLPIFNAKSMDEYVRASISTTSFTLAVLAGFAAMALLMAAVGLYGVVSHAVRQRARDLGIHLALGARSSDIVRQVVLQSLVMTAAGVVVGIGAAWAASTFMSGILYRIERGDLFTYLLGCAVVAGVAVAASYVPARRAGRIDPVTVLRSE